MKRKQWNAGDRLTRRRLLQGAVVLGVGSAIAACGGGGNNAAKSSVDASAVAAKANPVDAIDLTGKKIELTFWHTQTGPRADKLKSLIDAFNASQPVVTIKGEYQGNYTDLYKKLLSGVAAGQVPDISVAYPSQVSEYQSAKVVVALEDYINSAKYGLTKAEQDDYIKPYWDENKYPEYGGRLLSFPFTKSLLVMYYNADRVKTLNLPKTPDQWSWDDFVAACKAATSGTTKGLAVTVDASTFDGMIYSRGGKLISDDSKHWLLNQQPGLDSLSLYQAAIRDGWGYRVSQSNAEEPDFGAGRTTFTLASSSRYPFYKNEVDKNGKFAWSTAIIPHSSGSSPATVLYGASIAIFKTTPEKQLAAWQFLKYFSSPTVTADWSVATGYMPIRKSAVQSEKVQAEIKASPAYGVDVNQVAQYAKPETSVRGTQDTRTFIEDAVTKVITDTSANVKQVLDGVVQKGDQALAQG